MINENTEFEVYPYVGCGPLRFGMTPDEVAKAIGPPEQVLLNHLKDRVETRAFLNLGFSSRSFPTLNHIGFGRQMVGLSYERMRLFTEKEENVLKFLVGKDNEPYLYMGFLVFLKIGISLTGFHDKDISQKAAVVFPKGVWDNRFSKMKRWGL